MQRNERRWAAISGQADARAHARVLPAAWAHRGRVWLLAQARDAARDERRPCTGVTVDGNKALCPENAGSDPHGKSAPGFAALGAGGPVLSCAKFGQIYIFFTAATLVP